MPHPDELVGRWLVELDRAPVPVATLVCDGHPAEDVAVTVAGEDLAFRHHTFAELADASRRLATGLAAFGVGPGDRIGSVLPPRFELAVALVAAWRLGAVYVPLSAEPDPATLARQAREAGVCLVVCDRSRSGAPDPVDLQPVDARRVVLDDQPGGTDIAFSDLLLLDRGVSTHHFSCADPLIMLPAGGTTGLPRPVTVSVRALAEFRSYLTFGVDLRPDDVYWNAAGPGSAYGLCYGVAAPLLMGHATLLLDAPFDAALAWEVLFAGRVKNFAATPARYQEMRAFGVPTPNRSELRVCSSAGEPLPADVVEWSRRELGTTVRDHYGTAGLGMVAANLHHPDLARPLRPGSMGQAAPGWSLQVLHPCADVPVGTGQVGRIAVDVRQSSLMPPPGAGTDGAGQFSADGRWYYTGDAGTKDADGYLYRTGFEDDVMIAARCGVGPAEIESVLAAHPAVTEAAVIAIASGSGDDTLHAFVAGHGTAEAAEMVATELQQLVRERYGARAVPGQVHAVAELPRTPGGTVWRAALRRTAGGTRTLAHARAGAAQAPPAPETTGGAEGAPGGGAG